MYLWLIFFTQAGSTQGYTLSTCFISKMKYLGPLLGYKCVLDTNISSNKIASYFVLLFLVQHIFY